jgi:hypothetical protein
VQYEAWEWSHERYSILSGMEYQQRYLASGITDLEGCVEELGSLGGVKCEGA